MADYPALPLWTDAYLADTTHLSDAEHGRYLLLLFHMWRSPGCRFPNDGEWLCRKFKRTPGDFAAEIQPLLDEFCQCDGNWWIQKKLFKVWKHVRRTSAQRTDAAKSRWEKKKTPCKRNAGAALQTQCIQNQNQITDIPPSPAESVPPTASPNGSAGKPDPRGSRLSQDWEPGEKGVEYARNLGMSAEAINSTYHAFMRYWLAKAGKEARKVDWSLTWQTWVRRENERLREQAHRERLFQERYGAGRATH